VKYHPDIHHRRSIRVPAYDYASAGAYFVTICTRQKVCVFEDPLLKRIAEQVWQTVAATNDHGVDEFVIMPNHVHGIIWITDSETVGAQQQHRFENGDKGRNAQRETIRERSGVVAAPLQRHVIAPPVAAGSLPVIVRAFKSATAKRINNLRRTPGVLVWQRNYYEHIIRDDEDMARIRQYIRDNPRRWDEDENNPANMPPTAPCS